MKGEGNVSSQIVTANTTNAFVIQPKIGPKYKM